MINGKQKNIYQKKPFVILFATISAVAWACAFPLIKTGLTEFGIDNNDTMSKTLFAGIRFFAAGIIVLIIAKSQKRSFAIKGKNSALILVLFGIVNTSLHYFFFYLGLSNSTGSRTAILDSSGTFLLIILAVLFFKDEKFTVKKIIGCILGFAGIVVVNLGSKSNSPITFMGDGMIMLSALSSAFGGILTRVATKKADPLFATGFGLSFGGAMLILPAVMMGGKLQKFSIEGVLILVALILVSSLGFSLYNQLICYNPVGKIAIFNCLIPVLGVIFSCIFLKEPFLPQYIFASLFVTAGIFAVNKAKD